MLAEGFEKKSAEELAALLEFPHQQVRQEAQFEMASRMAVGESIATFAGVAKKSKNQLARLHAVWGLGMLARKHPGNAWGELLTFATDVDIEVKRAAVEQLGRSVSPSVNQVPPTSSTIQDTLAKLFTDPNDRVKAAAAVAYGKIGQPVIVATTPASELAYYAPLFDMLKANNDKDPYLRHAAVMGLAYSARNPADLWNVWLVAKQQAKEKYDVPAVRMGVLLALRKQNSDKLAAFLNDGDPRIVAEAARAVYDARMGVVAVSALAKLADKPGEPDAIRFPRAGRELHSRHAGSRGTRRELRRAANGSGLCARLRAQVAGRLDETIAPRSDHRPHVGHQTA